jgi:hypothetical protein
LTSKFLILSACTLLTIGSAASPASADSVLSKLRHSAQNIAYDVGVASQRPTPTSTGVSSNNNSVSAADNSGKNSSAFVSQPASAQDAKMQDFYTRISAVVHRPFKITGVSAYGAGNDVVSITLDDGSTKVCLADHRSFWSGGQKTRPDCKGPHEERLW